MAFVLESMGETTGFDTPRFVFEGVEEVSRPRSIAAAPIKGLVKGAAALSKLRPGNLRGPVPSSVTKRLLEESLPTQNKFTENFLEKTGEAIPAALLSPAHAGRGLLSAALGGLAGSGAKEMGAGEVGQGFAEALGYLGPDAVNAVKGLSKLTKSTPQRLESGLTKLRAVNQSKPKAPFSFITKNRQQGAIEKLNEEAAQLVEKSIEKHVPVSKMIREGVDFEGQFNKKFGEIQDMAKNANPNISTRPISNFFKTEIEKYSGIPNLHSEGKKIVNEIVKFSRNPRSGLHDLLKIYRSNNKKIKNIYETSQLKGKQKEYADFLVDYNRKIADSIKQTLPEDSKFVQMFESANKEYKSFKDALKTEQILKPILGENPTISSISKLAEDQRLQQKLSMSMGKEGADEVIQIAKDLKKSHEAIKRIPVKEFKLWDGIFPISILIPGYKYIKGPAAALKGVRGSKYIRGILLSSEQGKRSYSEALKAIQNGDKKGYIQATKRISEILDSSDKE